MLNIEKDFFTLYKSVDAVCRDMFSGKHYYNDRGDEVFGLSAYIRVMETESYKYRAYCSDWDEQYKKLKRLRWIRSQIAHEVGVSECTRSDLNDLDLFYRQLMDQSDILARAYRLKKAQEKTKKASKPAAVKTVRKQAETTYKIQSRKKERKKTAVLPWLIVATAVILTVILILKNLPG